MRIQGSPSLEHVRSPAAARVARLARESDLFFAHFEHRFRLPLPPSWRAGIDEEPADWVGGVLAEPKYQAFRHDLLIASFHPGHRAKWTAHELCHALVGFAYRPGAPQLFHAFGAWLAELLPVALWYFFDEAGLRRCPQHRDGGALFQAQCQACEQAALTGMRRMSKDDTSRAQEGRAYVDRELAAFARSRRLGRPLGTRFATLDLASDGLAYAHAHGPRLAAPEMERLVAQFFGPAQGHHPTLESLEARVLEVCEGITRNKRVRAWQATRWDYAAQDIGYRLLSASTHADGALKKEIDGLVDGLAARRTRAGLAHVVRRYRELVASTKRARKRPALPTTEELFAVGYDLPEGMGHALQQLEAGIASACPGTHHALRPEIKPWVARFALQDVPVRSPIGRRFARFLSRTRTDSIADWARFEAALTHVAPRDPIAHSLPAKGRDGDAVRLATGAEILRVDHDVLGTSPGRLRRARRLTAPRFLGVVRTGAQDVDVMELPVAVAQILLERGHGPLTREHLAISEEGLELLLQSGLVVPERYQF